MAELSKTVDATLYPEIARAGGLVPALAGALRAIDRDLLVEGLDVPPVYARVTLGERISQVMLAAHAHAFSVDFWQQGVQYGHGWTGTLEDVARAVGLFAADGASTDRMEAEVSWFVQRSGHDHEQGAAHMVDQAWRWLAERSSDGEPPGSRMRGLQPLVLEAARRPALRQLFPFTSMDNLCFSRTTGYPYSRDCPYARPCDDDRYRVYRRGEVAVGEGDAVAAADALVANLPPGCGPAVHGTSGD
jgi:hypothetical protein